MGRDQIVPQEGISAAEYPWRQLFATIAISGLEEAQNNGEEAIINLLEAKVMQAEETMKTKLNQMLYADGTGNSGKDFLGSRALLIGATGNVGGIDATDALNVWWRSVVGSATGAAVTDPKASLGPAWAPPTTRPPTATTSIDGIFTAPDHLRAVRVRRCTPNVRYQDTKSANAGFTS